MGLKYNNLFCWLAILPVIVCNYISGAPEITSIQLADDNSLTATLKFLPQQPSSLSKPHLYRVNSYQIKSHLEDDTWKIIHHKELKPDEKLGEEESAVIPLNLSLREKLCQYKVALHYCEVGDVTSAIYDCKVGAVGKLLLCIDQ